MDLGLFNVSDTYRYVLNQSGANAITLGNGNSVNWNSAGVVTLAGDQTIAGTKTFTNSIAFNGNITVTASTVNEGGQLTLLGGGSSYPVYFDNYDGNARIFGGSGPSIFATFKPNGIVSIGGNVGIGTDNPNSKLHLEVGGSSAIEGLLVRNYTSTSSSNAVIAAHVVGPNGGDPLISWDINSVIGWSAGIDNSDSDKFKIANHYANLASNTKVTIDGDKIGLGTTTPSAKLHLASSDTGIVGGILLENTTTPKKFAISSRADLGLGARFSISDETSSAERFIISSAGNVGIGRFPVTNKLEVEGNASKTASGSWLSNSDKRIKKAISTITDALEKICKVNLVKFKYTDEYKKDHPSIEDVEYLNVIAQEFAEVFPDHVKESGDKMPDGSPILQVDIHPLTIYSAAAIQELKQIIDSQNLRISELESKLL